MKPAIALSTSMRIQYKWCARCTFISLQTFGSCYCTAAMSFRLACSTLEGGHHFMLLNDYCCSLCQWFFSIICESLQLPKSANIPESCQNVDGIKICFGHSLICRSCISFALKAKLMHFSLTSNLLLVVVLGYTPCSDAVPCVKLVHVRHLQCSQWAKVRLQTTQR